MSDTPTGTAGYGEREPQYLYVCISNEVAPPPAGARSRDEVHAEHVVFLQDLFDRGILFGSGPQVEETGTRHGGAVYILQGVTFEEAKALTAQEPTIREGLRDVTIHPWRRMWFGG
jgi:uncharacterized protein YciI